VAGAKILAVKVGTSFDLAYLPCQPACLVFRVTRLGEISPFGRFFMAKFFLEKIAQ
jgi:hypothetical protein